MSKYSAQYQKDRWIRPTDTLFYIPTVENLLDNHSYQKKELEQRRKSLFRELCKGRILLSYTEAVDTSTGTWYLNPRGNLDFWEKSRRKVALCLLNDANVHPLVIKRKNTIAEYIRAFKPQYMFRISELDGISNDEDYYWSYRDNTLYVLRVVVNDQLSTFEEIEACYYIEKVAPDYFFSYKDRLSIYNSCCSLPYKRELHYNQANY